MPCARAPVISGNVFYPARVKVLPAWPGKLQRTQEGDKERDVVVDGLRS